MSDEEITPEPEATEGEIPQDVADDLAVLSTDVHTMARVASRGWKITAVAFAVVLLVIAGYLELLVRRPLAEYTDADTIVHLVFGRVDDTLRDTLGAPGITSPMLPDWVADRLVEAAPEVVGTQIRPQLQELITRLPEARRELVAAVEAHAPQYVDKGMDRLTDELLPQAERLLIRRLKEVTGALMDELEADLDQLVAGVLEQHREDLALLDPDEMPRLRQIMEQEIEREMGPLLDRVFDQLDPHVTGSRERMEELVEKYQDRTLTHEEMVEVQLIRLIRQLFEMKGAEWEGTPDLAL